MAANFHNNTALLRIAVTQFPKPHSAYLQLELLLRKIYISSWLMVALKNGQKNFNQEPRAI